MNAIIMAAGTSSRFAPLSYEKPKGLLEVKGEVLIERQIRQLQEAGISEIIVVVGYMADKFMYLKEKYGVRLVINEDYSRYNNTSSVIRVIDDLSDTYLCSSDNYFAVNVFKGNPLQSYYSALYAKGNTGEYCLTTNDKEQIVDVKIGGSDAWYMVGHVFFNNEFSSCFRDIMKKEYAYDETRQGYWEDVYIRNIKQLPSMQIHKYKEHEIEEFDTLDELRAFDNSYLDDTRSSVIKQICIEYHWRESELYGFQKADSDMHTFYFSVGHDRYLFDTANERLIEKV